MNDEIFISFWSHFLLYMVIKKWSFSLFSRWRITYLNIIITYERGKHYGARQFLFFFLNLFFAFLIRDWSFSSSMLTNNSWTWAKSCTEEYFYVDYSYLLIYLSRMNMIFAQFFFIFWIVCYINRSFLEILQWAILKTSTYILDYLV